eukprot:PhF_6_TR4736/c0_g1_i1/m.6552
MDASRSPPLLFVSWLVVVSIFSGFFALHSLHDALLGVTLYGMIVLMNAMIYYRFPYLLSILPVALYMLFLRFVSWSPTTLRAFVGFSSVHAMTRALDLSAQPAHFLGWTFSMKFAHLTYLTDTRFATPMHHGYKEACLEGFRGSVAIGRFLALAFLCYALASFTDNLFLKCHLYQGGLGMAIMSLDGVYKVSLAPALLHPEPIMQNPLAATSIRRFWQRWDIPIRRWLQTYIYKPCTRRGVSKSVAMGLTFIGSGVYHAVAVFVSGVPIRVVAMLGLCFVMYAFGIFLEDVLGLSKSKNKLVGWLWFFGYSSCVFPTFFVL